MTSWKMLLIVNVVFAIGLMMFWVGLSIGGAMILAGGLLNGSTIGYCAAKIAQENKAST